jgi:Arc/MetJ-type ribon-helix-helix transcriptional regulator
MKNSNVTFRLDPVLLGTLDRFCQTTGRSRSDVVRDALRRQLPLDLLNGARRRLVPLAEARGIRTDEDVFALLS